jgi:hypothetical protein
MIRRRAAVAAAAILLAGAPAGWLAVGGDAQPAAAATSACANSTQPVSGPVGCGALFLPHVGYAHARFALALSATAAHYGARAEVEPLGASALQDWMFYAVCHGLTQDRSAAKPCGSGGTLIKDQVVLRLAQDGSQPDGGVNSFSSYCLTDGNGRAYLGWCQSGSAFYDEGFPDPPLTNGAPPVVVNPNPSQVWALAKDGDSASLRNGYSHRYLDDAANGGPSVKTITYGWNGSPDQQWQIMGCTSPLPTEPGFYGCVF